MAEDAAAQEGQELEAPATEEVAEPVEGNEPEGKSADPDKPEVPPEQAEKPKPRGVAKRLQELTRQRDEWKAIAEAREAKPAQPDAKPEPIKSLADFGYDEAKYSEYVIDLASKRATDAATKAANERLDKSEGERRQERAAQEFQSREAKFAKGVKDYNEVVYEGDEWACSPAMAEAIRGLDEGPDLAYYLAKNPDVADDLAALPGALAGVEMGKIAARLAAEKAKAGKPVSSAPPPTPTVKADDAKATPSASSPDSDKLSMKQWLRQREKQLAKR